MSDLILLKEALLTIKQLKKQLQDKDSNVKPMAIIGLSCRLPQINNKHDFWQLLHDEKNIISPLPQHRLNLLPATLRNTMLPHHRYWGGYLNKIEQFDADFFGISPREAIFMDPQQRLLLEVTFEAIEDAGLSLDQLAGSNTGVYIGLYSSEYSSFCELRSDLDALYIPTGNASSIAANRLSYVFDLRGPSLTLDTACSTSLVTAHLACQAIQSGECEIALVGGVKINLIPAKNEILSKAKMLSPTGQCMTFDARANGYVQGEGVGVIIIKSLETALQDNDRIYGVIVNSTVNQDGKTNGLTAPNGAQQEALLKHAYQNVDPIKVGYIECHGTGTVLGDPIEVEALENIIGVAHDADHPCYIGSVKTNIGHLEPAAGVIGLIKLALGLHHQKIPKHLNYAEPNPHIPWEKYHLQIPHRYLDWPLYNDVRVGGVSSFGFGGTNSHIVMQESNHLVEHTSGEVAQQELFTLSAKNRNALNQLVAAWCDYLDKHPDLNLQQICYLLHVRRTHFSHRLGIIVSSIGELRQLLQALATNLTSQENLVYLSLENQQYARIAAQELDRVDVQQLAKHYMTHHIPWQAIERHRNYPMIDLPSYPWQHVSYWLNPTNEQTKHTQQQLLPGEQIFSDNADEQIFTFTFNATSLPEIKDTFNIVHIGYYIEMLTSTAAQLGYSEFEIKSIQFKNKLVVPEKQSQKVIITLHSIDSDSYHFWIISEPTRIIHAEGDLLFNKSQEVALGNIFQLQTESTQQGNLQNFVERIQAMKMPIGESVRWTDEFWLADKAILIKINPPLSNAKKNQFSLAMHPGIFDAVIQSLFLLLDSSILNPYLTTHIQTIHYERWRQNPAYFYAVLKNLDAQARDIVGDCYILSEEGEVLAFLESVRLHQITEAVLRNQTVSPARKTTNAMSSPPEDTIQWLQQQLGEILQLQPEQVTLNRPLQELGLDSLMAMSFIDAITKKIPNHNLVLAELLTPITLADVAKKIAKQETHEELIYPNPYLYLRKRITAGYRLFCFPYGGGGASIYKDWQALLPNDIEVCPVQLPGRENLNNEKPLANLDVLLDVLLQNLQEEFTPPYAFFGHSFGALIAYELCQQLQINNIPLPQVLFVSAYPAPHIEKTKLPDLISHLQELPYDIWQIDLDSLTEHQVKQVAEIFSQMLDLDHSKRTLAVFRACLPRYLADITAVTQYRYRPKQPLNIPIQAFYSRQDLWVSPESVFAWGSLTAQEFTTYAVEGGHMFIHDHRDTLIKQISDTIKRLRGNNNVL